MKISTRSIKGMKKGMGLVKRHAGISDVVNYHNSPFSILRVLHPVSFLELCHPLGVCASKGKKNF